jgi:hypothetical protein
MWDFNPSKSSIANEVICLRGMEQCPRRSATPIAFGVNPPFALGVSDGQIVLAIQWVILKVWYARAKRANSTNASTGTRLTSSRRHRHDVRRPRRRSAYDDGEVSGYSSGPFESRSKSPGTCGRGLKRIKPCVASPTGLSQTTSDASRRCGRHSSWVKEDQRGPM